MPKIESRQRTFNNTVVALARQGRVAVSSKGCVYRAPDGTKCALGLHIPDDKYSPNLEGMGPGEVILTLHLKLDPDLMRVLQRAHDLALYHPNTHEFVDVWESEGPDRLPLGGIAHNLHNAGKLLGLNTTTVRECWPPRVVETGT